MTQASTKYQSDSTLSDKYRIFHHTLFWIVYLLYFIFDHFFASGFGGLQRFPFIMIVDIVVIYLNTSILIPRFLVKKKIYQYFVFTLLSLCFSFFINYLNQTYLFENITYSGVKEVISTLSYTVTNSFVFLIIAISMNLLKTHFNSLSKIKQLKEANIKSELDFLKTQVNPHFLFNTLNNIKVLIKLHPQKAEDTLVKLSELMRYQLYDCSEDMVLLSSEIQYLKNYLDLQRIRMSNAQIVFNCEGNMDGILVYPFMFIPFIENAVKHGVGGKCEDPNIEVNIKVLNKTVVFFVENRKNCLETVEGGIGLINIKRRLDLLYPGSYKLEFLEEQNTYKVNLNLNLV